MRRGFSLGRVRSRPAAVPLVILIVLATQSCGSDAGTGWDPRDLNGVWMLEHPDFSNDITDFLLPGEEIAFTLEGAEVYRTLDHSTDPSNTCQSVGYFRPMQTPRLPFQIVQTPEVTAILMEYHYNFRLIYTDGRPHPADIYDYPELMGHSTATWEGDALAVDVVGFTVGTWLDTPGLQHSDQLHVTERFQRVDPDTIDWTVTIEDPVFYTKPFTYRGQFKRQDFRIMSYDCAENEQDSAHMLPTFVIRHSNPDALKFPN